MSDTEPIRTRIEKAIADTLGQIAAGDYRTTPALVTRALKPIDQYQKRELLAGPVLGVMRGSGSLVEADAHTRTVDTHRHRVAVWGYVLGSSDEPSGDDLAGDLLNDLWQDHVDVLLADPTLGGLVYRCLPEGPMETDEGAREPLAFFRQHWLAEALAA